MSDRIEINSALSGVELTVTLHRNNRSLRGHHTQWSQRCPLIVIVYLPIFHSPKSIRKYFSNVIIERSKFKIKISMKITMNDSGKADSLCFDVVCNGCYHERGQRKKAKIGEQRETPLLMTVTCTFRASNHGKCYRWKLNVCRPIVHFSLTHRWYPIANIRKIVYIVSCNKMCAPNDDKLINRKWTRTQKRNFPLNIVIASFIFINFILMIIVNLLSLNYIYSWIKWQEKKPHILSSSLNSLCPAFIERFYHFSHFRLPFILIHRPTTQPSKQK